jgi:chitodextrinase
MKMTMKKLICAALLFTGTYGIAQGKNDLWKKSNSNETSNRSTNLHLPQKNTFNLDVASMKTLLSKSPKKEALKTSSNLIITLPNGEETLENFKVYESSVMAPELAAKFPEIKSYVAIGVDNPKAIAYFSSSPLGFKSMTIYPDKEAVFIEPINLDNTKYTVYKKSERKTPFTKFECGVSDSEMETMSNLASSQRGADDGKLRTFRLAVSCTGEYANYFGGTKALALAGIVNTMTRVNGIFERDFGLRLVLIANNENVLYTNPTTDPYTDSPTYWGQQVQSTLTNVIGEANYDIGHLFGGTTAGGNANCRGCICVDGLKGSAYTGTSTPSGDNFDIDYVAHEMGHQLGANHSFTYRTESGNQAQMEPGSGSTIMSYAGTSLKDIVQRPDAYFHAISIQQVTDNIKTKTCATITLTGNATPVVNAGQDYTIPKGTPFMLNGSATDANSNDQLTYSWEQMDLGNATTSTPSSTATTGPLFRSYPPTSSSTRYFPNMNTILAGLTTTQGHRIASETLPGVARTMNFRLIVRDNRTEGGANNTDDVVITVDGNAGPFTVDSQNTTVSYAAGTTQTVIWTVAGTNANNINCANVDILLSTDGGQTFPIVLLAGTPNDGTQNVIIPNIPGTTNRIMVKGSNHIFFDVNNANFTITGSGTVDTTAPSTVTLSVSGTTSSSTNLSWTTATDNVGVTGYDVYQDGILKTTTTATTLSVTGLSASTAYSFYVRAKDAAGNLSVASNTVKVTTSASVDTTAPSTVTLSASGTTSSSTNLSWTTATDNVGVTGYDVYRNGVLTNTTTATTLSVTGLSASTAYSFYVRAKDAAGNVSTASNTVNITTSAALDTTAPSSVTLSASGTTTSSTNLSWTASTDNVGVTGYDIYQNGILKTTTTTTSLTVNNLSASTAYSFYVRAKDAAGNISTASNTVNVTTSAAASISTITYCNSSGGTSKEFINRVQLGTINNTSGDNNGYGDYTAIATNLAVETSNTITIIPGWYGNSRAESYNVWIDFNKNGIFESSELVFSRTKDKASSVSGTINIPTNALTGTTRMRVSMKFNFSPTACETFSNGEVEDYTINITSIHTRNSEEVTSTKVDTNEVTEITKLDFKLYPNPVKGDNIYFSGMENNNSTYRIFNQMGQQVASGNVDNNTINVSNLMSAIYIIEVTDGKSAGTKRFIKE